MSKRLALEGQGQSAEFDVATSPPPPPPLYPSFCLITLWLTAWRILCELKGKGAKKNYSNRSSKHGFGVIRMYFKWRRHNQRAVCRNVAKN